MKIRFMNPQPGKETVTTYILPKISSSIHLLPNISLNKDNSTMKFGQLMEYNKRNTFLQNTHRKLGRGFCYRKVSKIFVPDLFIFLKKLYMM